MGPQTRHYQQLAIAILAIASAALGFSFWSHDFDLAFPKCGSLDIQLWYWLRVVSPLVAALLFFALMVSVGNLFGHNRIVTAVDLVRGPLSWLYWEMAALTTLFISGYAPDLIIGLNSQAVGCVGP